MTDYKSVSSACVIDIKVAMRGQNRVEGFGGSNSYWKYLLWHKSYTKLQVKNKKSNFLICHKMGLEIGTKEEERLKSGSCDWLLPGPGHHFTDVFTTFSVAPNDTWVIRLGTDQMEEMRSECGLVKIGITRWWQ